MKIVNLFSLLNYIMWQTNSTKYSYKNEGWKKNFNKKCDINKEKRRNVTAIFKEKSANFDSKTNNKNIHL